MKTDVAPVTGLATADGAPAGGRAATLTRLFQTLEEAGIGYCVLHGYDDLPARVASDIDCVVSAEVLPRRLASVLRADRERLGARIVQWFDDAAHFIVLCGRAPDGEPFFVQLHACADYHLARRTFYSGEEFLRGRERRNGFWIPAPALEFASHLAKKIAKSELTEEAARSLEVLYARDPAGCRQHAVRLWGGEYADLVTAAAERAEWDTVRQHVVSLRKEQNRRILLRAPLGVARDWLAAAARRVRRVRRADRGLNVVLLGPDGSGKSSVVEAVRCGVAPAFVATQRRTFPPALLRRGSGTNATPHATRERSFISSVIRAVCYWFVYCTLGHYLLIRPAMARATLLLHDRHLVDALVDPKRYRYGGPRWLLRLIWGLVPKPDLVILLDAPAELVQARKQEVPVEETRRQLAAYRELVSGMRNGRVVDAAMPLREVVAAVEDLILDRLAARAAGGLRQEAGR